MIKLENKGSTSPVPGDMGCNNQENIMNSTIAIQVQIQFKYLNNKFIGGTNHK